MKINQIIRERRLAKGLTQEQIANQLGISVPAVNKWEKGTSYPDIVLLPALARLLETDLNTLLSFQDDLSEKEVALFLNEVSEEIEKNGFEAGYSRITEKLKEYPTCDLLACNAALLLDGSLMLHGNNNKEKETYQEEVEHLYHRAAQSKDVVIRNRAQVCLISKLMGKQEYAQVQAIIDTLPEKTLADKEQAQANLWIAQGEFDQAAKLIEEKLLSATNEVHVALTTLLEIALKQERMEDAEYIADIDSRSAELFDLWEYHSYVARFQLYSAAQNRDETLSVLLPMLRSLTKKWDIGSSPLYRHIQTKEADKTFGPKLQKAILQSIYTDENTAFLRDSPELQKFVKEMNLSEE